MQPFSAKNCKEIKTSTSSCTRCTVSARTDICQSYLPVQYTHTKKSFLEEKVCLEREARKAQLLHDTLQEGSSLGIVQDPKCKATKKKQ